MRNSVFKILIVSCTLLILGFSSNPENQEKKNILMVEKYWDQLWNKGNLEIVGEFYHPNAKHGEDFTIEGFKKGVSFQREAFPDLKVIVNDIFATNDKVICDVTYTGTHTGRKIFKQEALGKSVKVPGLDIFTFKEGKCVRHQHVADHLELVTQMGIKLTPTEVDKK